MQGVNQAGTWCGSGPARDHALVENRHQPTKVDQRTLVTERYKLTLYREQPWGEQFDLHDDPNELRNRFDDPACAGVKAQLLHRFCQAEMKRESTRMPRVAGA
jgi:hypothetical protein